VEAIAAFRRLVQRRSAERVVPTRHGTAFLSPSIRHVYDHNYLSVEHAGVSPAELAAEADSVMVGCGHRRVIVEDGTAGVADDFVALGYIRSTHLVLAHGRDADRRVDASAVREVELDELLAARTTATLREPWGSEGLAAELNDAKRHVAAAVATRFFGASVDGELAGWCELRADDGVAQIEDVEVLAEFRGRGLGRALVQHALDEGRRAAGIVFLEALADDWPRELYAKLGFVPAGRRDFYTRLDANRPVA
jgi:ribosomal protein S18 acetylase RimI-like enzyme